MNRLLRLPDRDRPVGGDAPGDFERGLQQVGGFDDAVDQTPRFRLRGAKGQARQDQLLGAPLADGAGQVRVPPVPGMMPSVTSVRAKRAWLAA